MSPVRAVFRRELAGYFQTPVAWVFLVIFLLLANALTFYVAGWYTRGQADLQPFFQLHPWLYLFLVPAVGMRLWAEERRGGSLELLLTLPMRPWHAVLGKFLAGWLFLVVALALTVPLWLTTRWLGDPDDGVILASYVGSALMAGAFLAVAGALSALTRNQVVAFVLTVATCFVLLMAGYPLVTDAFRAWAPAGLVDVVLQLGAWGHFQAITRGVLDARDVLYFLALGGLGLGLTTVIVELREEAPDRGALARMAALAVLFVAVVALAGQGLRGVRLDLTSERLHTLTDGSRRLLGSLESPVTLTFYYSAERGREYPQLRAYAQRVRELLEEMVEASGGRLVLEVVDPEPLGEDEDRATAAGLQGIPLPSGEAIFLALAGRNEADGRGAIPLFQPDKEAFLEYDLAKLVAALADDTPPVLAVLGSIDTGPSFDPTRGVMAGGWAIDQQLRERFELRRLQDAPTSIGDDVDVLLLVHPRGLPEDTLYAIDQFVLRGGRLLAFLDPDTELDALAGDGPRSADLGPLLAAWGVGFDAGQVVLDPRYALQVQPDPALPPARHPGYLALDAQALSQDDVITAQLETLNVATAGAFTALEGAPGRLEPLVQSSPEAVLVDAALVRAGATPEQLFALVDPMAGARHVLAARLSGTLPSAFPGRAGERHLAASAVPANVVLVADVDLLADRLWVESRSVLGQRVQNAFANNGDAVFNAVDNLVGNADLIAVRTRAASQRPFARVEALRREAEARLREKERELQAELAALEQRLGPMQAARGARALDEAQSRELERFAAERLRIRRELREVRVELDAGIRALGQRVTWWNIAGMPAAVALVALALAWRQRRLRRRAPR